MVKVCNLEVGISWQQGAGVQENCKRYELLNWDFNLIIEGLQNWDGDLIYQDFEIVWEMLSEFLILLILYLDGIDRGWLISLRKVMFSEPMISKTRIKGNYKVLLTCVTSTLGARRLLHKGSEAYLAHDVDKSSPKVIMDSMPVVWGFLNVLPKDLLGIL